MAIGGEMIPSRAKPLVLILAFVVIGTVKDLICLSDAGLYLTE